MLLCLLGSQREAEQHKQTDSTDSFDCQRISGCLFFEAARQQRKLHAAVAVQSLEGELALFTLLNSLNIKSDELISLVEVRVVEPLVNPVGPLDDEVGRLEECETRCPPFFFLPPPVLSMDGLSLSSAAAALVARRHATQRHKHAFQSPLKKAQVCSGWVRDRLMRSELSLSCKPTCSVAH